MARFLTNQSGPAGTLLLIDDLHLADTDTIELLSYLIRTTPENATLRVIGTYRNSEPDSHIGLIGQLADLISIQAARHLMLAPLPPLEAAVRLEHLRPVLGEIGPGWLGEYLLQRTGGIPFYLIHCAQELGWAYAPECYPQDYRPLKPLVTDGGGGGVGRQRRHLPLPWTVVESIHQRLAALSASGYEAVQIIAAAGGRMSGTLLLRALTLAGHDEHLAVSGIEKAHYARILFEEADRHTYRFAHLLIQDVVDADLSAARRSMLRRLLLTARRTPDTEWAPVSVRETNRVKPLPKSAHIRKKETGSRRCLTI
jgi:predicted ATPase